MTGLLLTGFLMGCIGSFHCISMCGPLALALPVVADSNSSRFFSTLLYNIGRVITYALLGAMFGIAGSTFAIFGYQQLLSITLGILIIVFILLPKKDLSKKNIVTVFLMKIRNNLSKLFSKKKYKSVFFIGVLNGFLPCGLIYLALAAAASTASVFKSSLFMAGFGLGTLPVMWSTAFLGAFIDIKVRQGIKKLYPYMMGAMAVLLIMRGLGLNIPYMSPALNKEQPVSHKTIECHD